MINIGLNGFGRIGKSILHQCIKNKNIKIKAINFPGFNINKIESYLNNDTFHKTEKLKVEVINNNTININGNKINILDKRKPIQNMWNEFDVKYLFETTGKFLTEEKAKEHNADYMIMCAPSKDNVPQFIFNGNHTKYKGQHIISNSSCTTNSIIPLLKILSETYGIEYCNFITVHAATASQNILDGPHLKTRSHRSVFNNIIPASTGASKSATKILPELTGRIHGTSVRIPTGNVSMLDINVKLIENESLENILEFLRTKNEIVVSDDPHLVSSDFMTTTNPTIIDSNACMSLHDNQFKFTIWYDNEWSYSSQALKLLDYINNYNK